MEFKDILIGHSFFDIGSGEYFIKTDTDKAQCISHGSFVEGLTDTFKPDEIVQLIEGE